MRVVNNEAVLYRNQKRFFVHWRPVPSTLHIQITMASVLLDRNFKEDFTLPLSSLCREVQICPDMYNKYRLFKVTHYKNTDVVGKLGVYWAVRYRIDVKRPDSAHEFLILDIFDGKHSFQLRIERGATTQKPGGPSDTISYIRVNNDRISRVLKRIDESKVYKIAVVRCPSQPMITLPDMCAIFRMIQERAPYYSLLSHQCYWFCATFVWGLEQKAKVVLTKGKDYERRGKAGGVGILKDDQVEKDMREYNEGLERGRKEAERAESAKQQLETKQGYIGAVARRKQEGARMAKKAQDIVTPLLQTSETKRMAEELALRSMLSRVAAEAKGERKDRL